MTDRYKGFTVALKADLRSDDAETVIKAIGMIKGVLSVDPILATSEDGIIEMRTKNELMDRIFNILK